MPVLSSFTPKLTADSLAYNDFRTDPSLASDLRDETLTGNSAADFPTKETGLSLGAPLRAESIKGEGILPKSIP